MRRTKQEGSASCCLHLLGGLVGWLGRRNDDDELRSDLKNIFAERYKGTVDICQHAADAEYSAAIRDLDHTERKLFDAGREGAQEYGDWKRHGGRLANRQQRSASNRHAPY